MEYREVQIYEICNLNSSSLHSNNAPNSIYYLDTGNITKNKIENLQLLDKEKDTFPSRAKRRVKDQTIIYSTVRPNQEHYGFIENPPANMIVSTGFTTIDCVDDNVDAKFLYYYLTQPVITRYLQNIAENSVSAYPSIKPEDIGNIVVKIPENLDIQKQISSFLSSLDKKIELNNKINQKLEAMAKMIYDFWFVQFDFPDANGKPYKSSGGKMVYNEELKREIPEGWEVKELSEIAEIIMGQSPSGDSYNKSEGTIFFQGSTEFGWRFPTMRQYTTKPGRMAVEGDILLSVRAPVGALNIADTSCCIGRGLAALHSKNGHDAYLYYVMTYFKKIFDLRNTSGTTFGSITKDDLYSLKLVYPTKKYLESYESIVSKYNGCILTNHRQNQKITQLRDWLLPMLMNGQVKVSEAANMVEEALMAAEPKVEYGKG